MTKEAKVGAFTLGGILLLAVVLAHLSGFHLGGSSCYRLYVGFTKAVGLVPQSTVCLSGVPVGKVESIVNEGAGVTVTMDINKGVRIPRDSTVTIESTGVMGEKFVSIMPGKGDTHLFEDGDYIIGYDEEGMDAMFANISKAVVQVQDMLVSINEIISDPQLKGTVVDMAVNMRDASAHISGLMAGLEEMVYMNQGNVQQIAQNLAAATAGMQRTMASVEHMMENMDSVAGDPQTAENLRLTLQNIADTSARVERMAANIEGVVADPQTAEDLRATIHNARELTDKADKMMGSVSKVQVKPSVDVLYSGKNSDWRTNFNVDVMEEKGAFLSLGVDDIGQDNLFNAQIGKRQGNLGVRAGVIASKPGIGLDGYVGKKWKFSADAYDLNDVSLRLRAQYEISDETYLMGEFNDVTDHDKRAAYMGIRKTF